MQHKLIVTPFFLKVLQCMSYGREKLLFPSAGYDCRFETERWGGVLSEDSE